MIFFNQPLNRFIRTAILMKKYTLSLCIVCLTASMVLFGCAPQQETETTQSPAELETSYPLDQPQERPTIDYSDQGYPVEEQGSSSEYVDSLTIPTPDETSAVVLGQLIEQATNAPYLAPGLYLGALINTDPDDPELPSVFSISTDNDPKAVQALDGAFVFSEVPPGQYALVIWSPMSLNLVKNPATSQELLIEVAAGETLDLGTIVIP